jgi:hypothetical protein
MRRSDRQQIPHRRRRTTACHPEGSCVTVKKKRKAEMRALGEHLARPKPGRVPALFKMICSERV